MTPIRKLLVANRGEIAIRVFRTCREIGIATVAVVAPDDTGSLHARSADEVVPIASYLHSEEHIRAAKQAGANAIHPGYGFLAESPDFADAVEAAGLVFIGPPGDALRVGADKLAAKEVARRAGIPVVPEGDPDEIGFPVVLKAAAGGGGRGMRVVREPGELSSAHEAAKREAKAAFGDDRVFCERYVERPRHVEVQVLVDAEGRVVLLDRRDCSIQRRHQKVLEESARRLDRWAAAGIYHAAQAFCSAIGYRGAGTVEFLVDGRAFYFLELNGRIQVEHPVSEVPGQFDLVRMQLDVAAGKSFAHYLPVRRGHAVEARLYAEDPRSFLPQVGRLKRLRLPTSVRVDTGVEEGDEIGTGYDPMIAKLIAHGGDREEAFDLLSDALAETIVEGVTTNLPFLRWLVDHPRVRAGGQTTAFLVENPPLSEYPLRPPSGPWRRPFRLNLPAPSPAAPPDIDSSAHESGATTTESALTAPLPGTVIRVLVADGDSVRARQELIVLEAMKMETPLVSPYDATVKRVHVGEGDRVAAGTLLVELEE